MDGSGADIVCVHGGGGGRGGEGLVGWGLIWWVIPLELNVSSAYNDVDDNQDCRAWVWVAQGGSVCSTGSCEEKSVHILNVHLVAK